MMYYYNSFFPFHIFGFISMIFFWVLIIALISLLFRRRPHHYDGDRALDILKERYAKGEITKQQYEEMKKDLVK